MTTDPTIQKNEPISSGEDAKPSSSQGWLSTLRVRLGLAGSQTLRETLDEALRSDSEGESGFNPEERAMLVRMLRFGTLSVEDVMVPRADIIAVDDSQTVGSLLKTFDEAGVSRVPIFRETLDDPRGMIHVKDLLSWLISESALLDDGKEERGIQSVLEQTIAGAKLRRQALFVPPSMPAMNLLIRMQTTRIHMAIIVDEYGGTDGLVTIEDLVEQIVGDIEDEHDEEEVALMVEDPRSGLIASARTPVDELEKALGVKLLKPEEEAEIDTLGGLIFSLVGRIPARGELISHPTGIEFEILEADPRRIKKLKIHRAESGDGQFAPSSRDS